MTIILVKKLTLFLLVYDNINYLNFLIILSPPEKCFYSCLYPDEIPN